MAHAFGNRSFGLCDLSAFLLMKQACTLITAQPAGENFCRQYLGILLRAGFYVSKVPRTPWQRTAETIGREENRMKRKRLLAAVMAAVMASTLTMGMPVTGYAMDQGTETVANEPEGSNSSDTAVTNPELDADSVPESAMEESAAVSGSQETKPDATSVAESTEAEGGAEAAPDTQNNTEGAAENDGAASAGAVGAAETKTFGNFEYEVNDNGTIGIAKYTGNETNVTIPETIEGKKVTSIGGAAFFWCESLTQITIPDSVTSIGGFAFEDCSSLQEITIPNSVTSIGDSAFAGCKALTQIVIPDSVTSVGIDVFYGCKALQQITIPNSVTCIVYGTFNGCTSLKQIVIPDSVTSIGYQAFYGC